jgi:hypothetical protein
MFNRAGSPGPIDFPSPWLRRRRPVLHDDGKVLVIDCGVEHQPQYSGNARKRKVFSGSQPPVFVYYFKFRQDFASQYYANLSSRKNTTIISHISSIAAGAAVARTQGRHSGTLLTAYRWKPA